jgi:uncharacterized protein (DUF58 family)
MIKLIGIGIIGFILFILEQKLYKRLWNRGLSVNIDFTEENIFEGDKSTLTEVIENRSRLPLSLLHVKFNTDRSLAFTDENGSRTTDKYYRNDIFMIGARQKVTRKLSFKALHRGVYSILNADLIASDLFLTTHMSDEAPQNTTIYVYPRPFDSEEFSLSLRQLSGEVLVKRHLLEDPFEYRGIREYQPYDSMKSINWKASAKTGSLKVNQNNYTSLKSVRIFMNLEDSGVLKRAENIEASIQIAAGLCRFFLSQGMQVSCYGNAADMFTGDILSMEAGGGVSHMNAVYRALARSNTDNVVKFTECLEDKLLFDGDGSFTCIVAPNQYPDFVDVLTRFQDSGKDYVWFYPLWESSTPKVPENLADNIRFIHIIT